MGFLVQVILPYILLYKYSALFIITFLAAFILPIPSGTLLIISAAFADQGYFKISTLLIVVMLANILGDNSSYWISRLYAKKFLYKINFLKKMLQSKNFTLIEKGVSRYPGLIVVVSRFEVLSTLTLNLVSGMSKTPYRKFLFYEVLGTILSVSFYAALGYFFSASWQTINQLVGNFTILFFLMIALLVTTFWKKVLDRLNRIK